MKAKQLKDKEETESIKEGIRCLNCGKRMFDGSPGFDIITGEAKTQHIICPRCGKMNIVYSEISEKIVIKLEE